MDMIDQYLDAVAAQLPEDERDDIIAELRDLILNRFEDKESELGRALNDEERLEILRQIGHPLVVAARYRKGPDTLIGPELFPYWLFAVKVGLVILAFMTGIALLVYLLSEGGHVHRGISQALHDFFWAGLSLVGAVTLIGAFLEHNKIRPRWMTHWRMKDIKALSLPASWILPATSWKPAARAAAAGATRAATATRRTVRRRNLPGGDHVVSLVAHGLFLAWWTGLVTFDAVTHIRRHGEDVLVTGAPIWTTLHEVILVYVSAHMLADIWALVQPEAMRAQAALEVVLSCASLWLLWTVWQAGHWFTLTNGADSVRVEASPFLLNRTYLEDFNGWFEKLGAGISLTFTWAMAIIGFFALVRIVRALVRLARG